MMQRTRRNTSTVAALFTFLELVFHTVVRNIRNQSGNAALGIVVVIGRILIMVAIFFVMFELLGLRSLAVRGDFLIYLISGIFLFLLHNATMSAVMSAGNPVIPMMLHAPMTTMLNVVAAALAQLYLHTVAVVLIFIFIYMYRGGLDIHDPSGLIAPFLLAWGVGIGIGLNLMALRPFFPQLMNIFSLILRRSNMITSGKMFLANSIPGSLLIYFSWNPLFHCIDQARGAAFVNYFPRNTSLDYPIKFLVISLVMGMMAEFWLRKNLSQSTSARK